MPLADEDRLVLPIPKWPFLVPGVLLVFGLANGLLQLFLHWHGALGWRILAIVACLGYLYMGLATAIGPMASLWREFRTDGATLQLHPYWGRLLPSWTTRLYSAHLARHRRGDHFEVALEGARLEWVGRTLLLHTQPEMGVRLGRGARAERAAQWLEGRGVPKAIGR